MMNHKNVTLFIITAILFFACSDDKPEASVFSVNINADSFSASGGNKSISLTSNISWNAASNQDWLTVSPSQGSGDANITITATQNNTAANRTAVVTIVPSEGNPITINISQSTDHKFRVNALEVSLKAGQKESTIELTANSSWNASSDSEWLTVTPTTGTGDKTLTIATTPNDSNNERKAIVTLSPEVGDDIEVVFTQAGTIFSADENSVSFGFNPAKKTILLDTDVSWTATSSEEWLEATPNEGEIVEYEYTQTIIEISAQRNASKNGRSATITLTPAIGMPIVIEVTQNGSDEKVDEIRYVAVNAQGNGNGNSEANAANFLSTQFWSNINNELKSKSIEVKFLPGDYVRAYINAGSEGNGLAFNRVGDEKNRLIITGGKDVVFTVPEGYSKRNTLIHFHGCQNITFRDFNFTGHGNINYVVAVRTPSGFPPSQNISIENCTWTDMLGVVYGATGCHYVGTTQVTYKNCVFKRIGVGTGSHMMYHAYGPTKINVIDCHFEDCKGEYVRFRDRTDYGLVKNSTFVRNMEYDPLSFINIAVYNNVDPGDEYFGTNFAFFDNTFTNNGVENIGAAIFFRHRGFNPPEYRYLPTRDEGTKLTTGTRDSRNAQFIINFGIDFDKIRVVNNNYSSKINNESTLYTYTAYGAVSLGWQGTIVLNELLNRTQTPFTWEGSW